MMRKLTHEEIVSRQKEKSSEQRLPFSVVLNNIRSLYNVGAIFRTADGAGVERVWLCGITGHPPRHQIKKIALGADEQVPWEYSSDVIKILQGLKKQHYQIVLLEQTAQSVVYTAFEPQAPVCLVIGNEIEGISQTILSYCDAAIEIDMAGIKNSLNVAVAFGIAAYHIRRCLKEKMKCL